MGERLGGVRTIFLGAFTNRPLRQLEFGYSIFFGAELVVWLALLVYAYGYGGPASASIMALVQLVPCALVAPFLGAMADRRRPGRVLFVSYLLQAISMAGVAGSIASGAPT